MLDILGKKIKKEYIFIVLFLLGSLLFFDLVGIDYSSITGAQVGGDIDIGGISKTFENLYNLIFQGFLAPVFSSVGGNSVIAVRILVALIVFAVISFGLRRSERFGRMGDIIAILIGLLTAAFIPQTILDRFFGTSGVVGGLLGVFVGVALVAILFYFNYKWEPEGRIGNIFKGLGFILMVFIIIYFAQQYGAKELGNSALINIFNIVYAVAMLVCVILGFYYLFYRGFAGAATAVTEAGGLGPAGAEQARRTGRFFWNRGRRNAQNQNITGNQNQRSYPQRVQNRQNQNIGRNYIGQITAIAQGYDNFLRTIQAGGNGNIQQSDIRLFGGRLRSWIAELSSFSNDINRIVQNPNEKTQILNLTRIVATMFINANNKLAQNTVTYNQIADSLNKPNNFIPSRLRNIITLLQRI